jgi:TRAP-type C4-dicarboxylate transport system permease small subunit
MPWCQVRRGHILVDFFTARASAATQGALDRLGALLLALAMALLAWRTTLGGLNAWNTQSTTMMMGLPEWIVYAGMVPPLALTALIALLQALRGFDGEGAAA